MRLILKCVLLETNTTCIDCGTMTFFNIYNNVPMLISSEIFVSKDYVSGSCICIRVEKKFSIKNSPTVSKAGQRNFLLDSIAINRS